MLEMPEIVIPSTVAKYCDIILRNHNPADKSKFGVNMYDENRNFIRCIDVELDANEINKLVYSKMKSDFLQECHRNETMREFFNRKN